MKKIFWALSVVLVLVIATGASADTRSDKCNTYSNDLGISSAVDSYYGVTGSISDDQGAIDYYTNKDRNAYLLAGTPKGNTNTVHTGDKYQQKRVGQ